MPPGFFKDQHVLATEEGGGSKLGPMTDGFLKDKHVLATEEGGGSKLGPMTDGFLKDEHVLATNARENKIKARERVLLYLNANRGGGWYLVTARATQKKGAKLGEMNRDPEVREGGGHVWCYAQGINTYTGSQVKEHFIPKGMTI
jgi:hypothetical protein